MTAENDSLSKRITQSKKRKCLRCDKFFVSKGIGNRICPKCSSRKVEVGNLPVIHLTRAVRRCIENDYNDDW